MLNLCVNARDAMPTAAPITIARATSQGLAPTARRRLRAHCRADDGCGMPPEVLARVFEPFFTTKDVGKGSGLGLPQVYGFAQQSGGQLDIESRSARARRDAAAAAPPQRRRPSERAAAAAPPRRRPRAARRCSSRTTRGRRAHARDAVRPGLRGDPRGEPAAALGALANGRASTSSSPTS
jgi:signal transduction histidine kinase